MELKKKRGRKNPESKATDILRSYMKAAGWYTKKISGNQMQAGWPDFWATHPRHGQRWIEVKLPPNYLELTQIAVFSEMFKGGTGVYILRGVQDYSLLFKPTNFPEFRAFKWRAFKDM